jgi:pimeloyl-ACP methyl ester carboxylesterase
MFFLISSARDNTVTLLTMAATLLVIAIALGSILLAIHIGFRAPRREELGTPGDYGLSYQELGIQTLQGKRLFAWWLPAEIPGSSTMILLHGWGGNAELMLPLAIPLHNAGMNVLLLDARNHGRSDSASFSSLPRFSEDVSSAINWVKTHGEKPLNKIGLLGHSVGAGAVLLEASRRDDVSAVISISAFAHPEWMMRRYLRRFWIPQFVITWINRYVEWVIRHRFDDIAPMNTAEKVKCPILLVHGKMDETVPISDTLAIKNNCGNYAIDTLLVDDAGHDSTDKIERHAEYLINFLRKAEFVS